jgi:hypothetical protein
MRQPEGRATLFFPKLAPMERISTKRIAELLALIEYTATGQVGNLPHGV